MTIPQPSIGNAAETRQLIRGSADEVIATLPDELGFMTRYSLGYVASAVALSEGIDSGHRFASDTVSDLDLPPRDTFEAWKSLYVQGDQKALPKARHAAGLVETSSIVQEQSPRPERLVALVEAGDAEIIATARDAVKNVFISDRTALFGRLYRTGDTASFDLALESAKAAKQYAAQTGDTHHYRNERAMYQMAGFAAQNQRFGDAFTLMEHITEEGLKADLHIDLYQQGETGSLQFVCDYLEQTTSMYRIEHLERKLVKAGYAPALESVKNRVEARTMHQRSISDIGSDLEDLAVLHEAGVEGADRKVAEVIRLNQTLPHHLFYLGRVGLTQTHVQIATELFKANPSAQNAADLLDVYHHNTLWSMVFNHSLYEQADKQQASAYIQSLARRLEYMT